MKKHSRALGGFRWEDVAVRAYKKDRNGFQSVTRQVLFDEPDEVGAQLRYFEIGPGGYTTLERHRHVHSVMVLCGEGRVVVGREVLDVGPLDLVRVPSWTWHQFLAQGEAFGFLCLVRTDRDRPVRPTPEEVEDLRRDPTIGTVLRYP